ncbi:MAG: hypothetical protein EBR93_06375, partial [Bacteroidetes bacterium]|nr:hypothetical protein [Bacteroidota bacterium]
MDNTIIKPLEISGNDHLAALKEDRELLKPMKQLKSWVGWVGNKQPISVRTGLPTGWLFPSAHVGFEDALTYSQNNTKCKGIGFCFTDPDSTRLVFIDLDDCINEDGSLSELASEVIKLSDSYIEVSPSGGGLHIFGYGKLPGDITIAPQKGHFANQ